MDALADARDERSGVAALEQSVVRSDPAVSGRADESEVVVAPQQSVVFGRAVVRFDTGRFVQVPFLHQSAETACTCHARHRISASMGPDNWLWFKRRTLSSGVPLIS